MGRSLDELEAQRRVATACRLIEAAYRLHSLDPRATLHAVRTAICAGAEQQAQDIAEQAGDALRQVPA